MGVITKSTGTTQSEKYLAQLCERSFLNLWSYPNIFRNQGHRDGKTEGKEICDLLVVCGNHIIIFSEKTKGFPDSGNLDIDWRRWFSGAILDSIKQIRGAERWLTQYPQRVFFDRKCNQPLPIDLPKPSVRHMHRVVVAQGAAERCRQWFRGGSGSLCIVPDIRGKCHTDPQCAGYQPFAIGDFDPDDTFVHVLDDVSLDILLGELDTITDFVNYLERKEKFFRSGHLILLLVRRSY